MTAAVVDGRLIDALYGTAVQVGNWRPALDRFCNLLHSCEAALTIRPDVAGRFAVETTGRVLTPEVVDRYADHFGRLDPKASIFSRQTPGYLFNDARHFDERFVARNVFYQQYSRPLGTRHTLDMLAQRGAGREVFLAVMRQRRAGPYEPSAENLFRTVSAHFVRALALKEKMDRLSRAGDALDSLSFGVAVVDSLHRVTLLNRAAEEHLMRGGELRLCRGALSASSPACGRRLASAIDSVLAGNPEGGMARLPTSDGRGVAFRVAPLPNRPLLGRHASSAVLLIFCGGAKHRLGHVDFASLYGFTRAESRLAIAIAEGLTLRTIAARHEIKYSTVRSQLLSVMEKMGVHRQADVARLLAQLSRPD